MKYEQTKGSGLDSKTLRSLEKMAMETSYTIRNRGGLDSRMNDGEDFPEIPITEITRMLERAYKLGRADGKKTEKAEKPMKEITGYASKAAPFGNTWIVRIKDLEAARTVLLNEMTGWSIEDAKKKFNQRLEPFGYRITEIETV